MKHPKAVIVGTGIAGLASAIRLSVHGFRVHVYEKNNEPGGKLGHLEVNGYNFDTGASLLTQPESIAELFELAGEPINDYLQYERLPVTCRYFYEDGTVVDAYADKELFAKELEEKAGESSKNVIAYLEQSAGIYENIGKIFLNNSLHKRSTLFKAPIVKALAATRWPYLFSSLYSHNSKRFTSPKTVQLFNRFATYNGSDPYRAPGMLSMISHLEHNQGAYYPKGGMISIVKALYQLALKKRVHFHFNAPVQRIIRSENKVRGVVVNEQNINADVVISNADIHFTYKNLLQDENKTKRLMRQERSSSALIFYWGINAPFPQLQLHNIFFSLDYKKEFEQLFKGRKAYTDPTIYLNITAKQEPGIQAPEGKENWFIMVNVPANRGQDWEAWKNEYRTAVIDKLNRILQTNIEPLIETETILDPVGIEANTQSFMGSLYGSSSNTRMAAFMRHPNFTDQIAGLYFTGGSVHPGGGIPLCLKSAKITSDIILADNKKKTRH